MLRIRITTALVILVACPALAATVNYSLWPDTTDGVTFCSPGSFLIYASDSTDNGGLASFSLDLNGPIDSLRNRVPGGTFEPVDSELPTKSAGFRLNISANTTTGIITGSQDLLNPDNIPVYGFGQSNGSLAALRPPDYFGFQPERNNGSIYNAPLLIASGHYNRSLGGVHFDQTSAANSAQVFDDQTGLETIPAQVFASERIFEHFPQVRLQQTVGCNNVASGGALIYGQVNTLTGTADQRSLGSVPIAGIGNEPGFIYVMMAASGFVDLNSFTEDVGPSDPEYAKLHEAYPFWNILFKFPNVPGPKVFSWDLVGFPTSQVSALAVVPEPATLTVLVAIPILLSRRRSR